MQYFVSFNHVTQGKSSSYNLFAKLGTSSFFSFFLHYWKLFLFAIVSLAFFNNAVTFQWNVQIELSVG